VRSRAARRLDAEQWPDHPALCAWRELGGEDPSEVLVVKEEYGSEHLSRIYWLAGVRPRGAAVVAKRSARESIALEQLIYEAVLAQLAVPTLRCLGSLRDADPRFGWLFLEAAEGADFDAAAPAHRASAAAWLAGLHTGTQGHALLPELPDRGPAYYLDHLRGARQRIALGFENPVLSPPELEPERECLDAILRGLDVVESWWASVEDACERIPRTLVHGDFAWRNVRIEGEGPTARTWVFDWEVAGSGVPGVDLLRVDAAVYADAVRERWPHVDVPAQVRLGRLLRGCLAPIGWESLALDTPGIEKPLANLASCRRRLDACLAESGWAPGGARRRARVSERAREGTDPRDHPAARAWRRLGGSAAGLLAVSALRQKQHAQVYRLEGIGASGSVVAKRTARATGAIERCVYTRVLPRLPLRTPGFHGALDEGEVCWLFLEDVGDARPEGLEARPLLSAWLARLHTSAAELAAELPLPACGPDAHRERLHAARGPLHEHLRNPALSPADRWVLRELGDDLARLDARWSEIEGLCARMPRTLVHGDLSPQNLRLRAAAHGDELLVLDWETAGVGPPAIDLVDVDPALYASLVAHAWPEATPEAVQRWQRVGRILSCVVATVWEGSELGTPWVERPMARLRVYRHELRQAMESLDRDAVAAGARP